MAFLSGYGSREMTAVYLDMPEWEKCLCVPIFLFFFFFFLQYVCVGVCDMDGHCTGMRTDCRVSLRQPWGLFLIFLISSR